MNQQNRPGGTVTSSVSLSKEVRDMVDQYGLSLTEVVRVGIGILMYEKGHPNYRGELNEKRHEILKKVLPILADEQRLMKFTSVVTAQVTKNINKSVRKSIEKIIKEQI